MIAQRERTCSDEWLLTARALQQVDAFHGDLGQQWLLAEEEGDVDRAAALRAAGSLYRCRDGSVVVTDEVLVDDILHDRRFTSAPESPDVPSYTMECVDEVVRAEEAVAAPSLPLDQDAVDAAVNRQVRACGDSGERDVVTELIKPVIAEMLREALNVRGVREDTFAGLLERSAISLDAAVCPQRLPDAHRMEAALPELRNLCGVEGFGLAVFGTHLAVNLTAKTLVAMLRETRSETAADVLRGAAPAHVERALLTEQPLQVHRVFAAEEVELGGRRMTANSRVLLMSPDTGDRGARTLLATAHPRLASWVVAVAIAVSTAVMGQLPRLRSTGRPVRRLRAPVTHAVIRLPTITSAFEVR